MSFNPARARRNISIEFVDKDYSKFSVYPIVASYILDYLHLDKEFKGVLKIKRHNFSFSEVEYFLFLFTIIFLGIKHLYKADDLLQGETQLSKILGFKKERFPDSSSLYRFLAKADYWAVKRLDKVNFSIIKKHKNWLSKKRWLTGDIDQTKKITEGKQIEKAKPCFDLKRRGRLGLKLSAFQLEGLTFAQKLEPGNAGNADALADLLLDTLTKLGKLSSPLKLKRVKNKRIILRVDGGYFSNKTLKLLEEYQKVKHKKLDFVIRAKVNLKLVKQKLKEINRQDKRSKKSSWQNIDGDMKVLRLTNQQVLPDNQTPYTVLVIQDKQNQIKSKKKRVYKTKKTIEYVLVTSLNLWSAKRIIKFYKKRQQIENIFKDFNQSFKADKLPSHSFWGNALYFQMVAFVANITLFLSKRLLKEDFKMPLLKH